MKLWSCIFVFSDFVLCWRGSFGPVPQRFLITYEVHQWNRAVVTVQFHVYASTWTYHQSPRELYRDRHVFTKQTGSLRLQKHLTSSESYNVLGLQCAQSSDHYCKMWYSESDSEWFEYQYITTGRLYNVFKVQLGKRQCHDIRDRKQTSTTTTKLSNGHAVEWQLTAGPAVQYRYREYKRCCGTFAEPVRKIHVSNVRNPKNWKYMITASQNIKNYWKTPLEQKVMYLRQNHLFLFKGILDFRVDLRSDNDM